MASVMEFIQDGSFGLSIMTGFGAGFLIASLVYLIRAAVKIFARIAKS